MGDVGRGQVIGDAMNEWISYVAIPLYNRPPSRSL
jgi:hypothetical protein